MTKSMTNLGQFLSRFLSYTLTILGAPCGEIQKNHRALTVYLIYTGYKTQKPLLCEKIGIHTAKDTGVKNFILGK